MTTPLNKGTVPAAVPADQVQRLLFDIRDAMLRYGVAFKIEDEDGIRTTTTEACELLDRLATLATSAPPPVEAREPMAWRINTMEGHDVAPHWVYAEKLPLAWAQGKFKVEALYATHPKEPTEAREASAEGAQSREAHKAALTVLCAVQNAVEFPPNMEKDIAFAIEATRSAPGMVEEPSSKGDGRG